MSSDMVREDAGADLVFLGDGDDDCTPYKASCANTADNNFVHSTNGNDVIADLLRTDELRGDGPLFYVPLIRVALHHSRHFFCSVPTFCSNAVLNASCCLPVASVWWLDFHSSMLIP